MPTKSHRPWRTAVSALAIAALPMLIALHPVMAASKAPIKVIDRGARSEWIDDHAWGGGVRFVFNLTQSTDKNAPSLDFLAGAAPEFTLGCTTRNRATSYWRFRVGATPPGQGITGEQEIEHDKGMAHYFGAAGVLILYDEADQEMRRIPLSPMNGALETDRLTQEDIRSFHDASAIRAETPYLVFMSGTIKLHAILDELRKLPCVGP